MNINIKDKKILIFGASSGIGSEIVKRCLEEGALVVGTFFRNPLSINDVRYRQYKCDVTIEDDVIFLFKEIKKSNLMIDVLIDCVGIINDSPIVSMKMSNWEKVIEVNLTGAFSVIKNAPSIMNNKESKIICVSSVMGIKGRKGQVNYSVSKAGLGMLVKVAAMELATENIAINIVCPGFISTKLNSGNVKKRQDAILESYLSIDKNLECFTNFVLYMISDFFSCVTGQTFIIDSRIERSL